MIKNKDFDIKSLVRESFHNAMKQTGMLREQGEKKKRYVKRPFNKETDMPKVELKAGEWKNPKKPSAKALDVVLEPLIIKGSSATDTYKKTIKNISEVLGMEVTSDGSVIKKPESGTPNTVKELLSSLQVKDIMHSIIFYHEAQAAGKMFEGLVARMLGGTAQFDELNPIQDIAVGNEYISLKLISEKSKDFKGSKFNLAKGINEKGKVTYLILVKSSEQNPFSVRAYSFSITQQNYFSFVTGRFQNELSDKAIYAAAAGIVKPAALNAALKAESLSDDYIEAIKLKEEPVAISPKRHERYQTEFGQLQNSEIDNGILRYAIEKNPNFDKLLDDLTDKEEKSKKLTKRKKPQLQLALARELFKTTIANILTKITEESGTPEEEAAVQAFFKNHFKYLDVNSKEYALRMFPADIDAVKSLMTDYPDQLFLEFQKLQGLSDIERFYQLESDPTKKAVLKKRADFLAKSGEEEEQKNLTAREISILRDLTDEDAKNKYDNIFKLLNQKIVSLATVFDTIKKYSLENSARGAEIKAAKADSLKVEPGLTQKKIIEGFFKAVQTGEKLESEKEGPKVETQFKMNPKTALEIARRTNSEYDEDYPVFYIQKEWIMMSSQENIKLLDEVLVPFFSGVYDIKSGLEQYFTYDEVEGLEEVGKGIDNTSAALESHEKRFAGLTASQITPEKVTDAGNKPQAQLQENKKPLLTNPKLSAILDELLEK